MKRMSDKWKSELRRELLEDILPFWTALVGDDGRPVGRVDGHGAVRRDAPVGTIMAARMLYFFSAVYRFSGRRDALDAARRVRHFILSNAVDRRYGGVYRGVSADGTPACCRKQTYDTAFVVYALAEYALAAADDTAIGEAAELFGTLEKRAYDALHDGYVEAFGRDWSPLDDMRLSAKDENAVFSMNTHLHLLEAYSALSRVLPSAAVSDAVRRLLRIHTERIIDPATGHLRLFFDEKWRPSSHTVSFGHDIEASWLLDEAARAEEMDIGAAVRALASAAAEGLQPDGSMIYEYDPATGRRDAERHWWVQAETAVGYMNMYRRSGDAADMRRSRDAWRYIAQNIIDKEAGEWFWSVRADGSANRDGDKAGFWKCPYHSGRMCMQIAGWLDSLPE